MELVLTFLGHKLGGYGDDFPKILQEGSQAHTVPTFLSQEQNSFRKQNPPFVPLPQIFCWS